MGTRSLLGLLLAAMLSGAISEPASGAVHMVVEIQDFKTGSEAPRRAHIWVAGNRVRIDDSWEAAGITWSTMLYHGDEDVFFALDQEQQSYIRFDRPTLTAIGATVRMLRVMLDSKMAGLSSEQRATATRMLGSSETFDKGAVPLATHDTGTRAVVDGLDCRVVEVRRGGSLVGMAWVANWELVALEKDSLRVFTKLAALLGELNGTVNLAGVPTQLFEVFEGFGGFPVRVRWYRDGKPTSEVRFISVTKEETQSQVFGVPDDYRRRGLGNRAPASAAPAR